MIAAPLLHGSFGFWDEALSALGAVVILFLITLLIRGDKTKNVDRDDEE